MKRNRDKIPVGKPADVSYVNRSIDKFLSQMVPMELIVERIANSFTLSKGKARTMVDNRMSLLATNTLTQGQLLYAHSKVLHTLDKMLNRALTDGDFELARDLLKIKSGELKALESLIEVEQSTGVVPDEQDILLAIQKAFT
jgi:hypothetical protein